MSNLTIRVVVAILGIPVILAASLVGRLWFFSLVAISSSLALWEFYRLAGAKGVKPIVGLGIVAGLSVNLSFYHAKLQSFFLNMFEGVGIALVFPTQSQLFLILFVLIVLIVCLTELFRNADSPLLNIAVTLLGVGYISLFFGTLVGIRELFVPLDFPMLRYFPSESSFMDAASIAEVYSWGGNTVISLFACIWICDTGAYVVGRSMGRHKLFPRVSPNKTWEGAVAGFFAAIGAAIAAKVLLLEYMTFTQAGLFGLTVGIFGQMGDLVESLFKRDAGVKDTSSIIPGHGGVFDRFDSLIFVSPIVYLYLDFVVFS